MPTFESLVQKLESVSIGESRLVVKEMKHTSDFVTFIETYLNKLSGHTAIHQFKITRENNEVKMFIKVGIGVKNFTVSNLGCT